MGNLGIFDDERKKWIQFDSDAEVELVFLDREGLVRIGEKGEKVAKRTGAIPTNIVNIFLGRRCVQGWRKIDDHSHPGLTVGGKPLEFSQKNLDMLMLKCLEFSKFVNDAVTDSKLFIDEEADIVDELPNVLEDVDPKNA